MSKLDKHANLYDKDGNLLRHVNENGVLEDYTIEELEKLADDLYADKDEKGLLKHPREYQNVIKVLMGMYAKYGNPHESEILEALNKAAQKPVNEQVTDALEEAKEEVEKLEVGPDEFYKGIDEEYGEYEKIK